MTDQCNDLLFACLTFDISIQMNHFTCQKSISVLNLFGHFKLLLFVLFYIVIEEALKSLLDKYDNTQREKQDPSQII